MKKFMTFLFCALASATFAQTRFEAGVYFNKEIGSIYDNLNDGSFLPSKGYSIGFKSAIPLKPKLDLQVGLLYNQHRIGHYYGGCVPPVPTVSVTHRSLELETSLRYQFYIGKRINLYATAGVSQYFKLREMHSMDDAERIWEGAVINGNPYEIAGKAGLGLRLKISEKVSMDIEMNARYYFNDNPAYRNRLAPGGGIGLNFAF